jgi:alpha-beta hydrolase superfamily lysophospholipase
MTLQNGGAKTANEREVTFLGAGGAKLAGTLTLPSQPAGAKFPGIIIVTGSGPVDRNGNVGAEFQTNLYKQIAENLAKQGIASLRYDKRGIGGSAANVDPAKVADLAAWENFVDDVSACFRCLQQQKEIDPARTGMLGHSEGGLLVLESADRLRWYRRPPVVLVLASTAGRTIDVVIHEQLVRALTVQHATPEQSKFFLDKNAAITGAIRKTGKVPLDVPAGLAALYPSYIGKFYLGELKADPAKLAAKFPGPVLILQGEKDVQVSAKADAPALDKALKSRTGDAHTLAVIPGVSHNLKPVKNESDPAFAGDMAPEAMSRLSAWLKAKLSGPTRK